ncbi:MAG: threonyl-tRNA synthetase, partial [Acidimicrobiaceae bacterium]|nr:threonyl-tRNA synthetase [Acidimicrobiaceae bacterium]
RDAIGRRWQLSTIQLDFNMNERFGLEYVGSDNARHRPVMIHRALLGSVERFFGVLLEHYAGAFPTWLAPVQVKVLPVSDGHETYARRLVDRFNSEGYRAELGPADDSIGKRVRSAKLDKIPYLLVVGDTDVANGTVGVNARGQTKEVRGVPVEEFRDLLDADLAVSKIS